MKRIVFIGIAVLIILAGCSDSSVKPPLSEESKTLISDLPQTPSSFSKAKKLLYENIYRGHQRTLYCGCDFTKTRRVYLGSCDTQPRKNMTRAKRLEAEHVFPAHHFGQHRACWHKKLCTDSKGKVYGGRKCCNKIDPVFKTAHNDLHNLYPANGEINGDRSNYKFGEIPGEKREYGQCDFEIDRPIRRAEPANHLKGNIARTYLYMSDTYKVRLSKQQQQLFNVWNLLDPVDDWERERNRRIMQIQGNGNPYIQ